ncbi:hypothetical protein GTS_46160 [Gandjariella thermophila]|uniref:Uncharacterized protein n=1 Tax=Gandjariella thermophila TaxID=1931992 RepID=A0A4D4JGG9_9PSEU|nr:hypothetical protein GTS_46160 [Gandjariella thermophila]
MPADFFVPFDLPAVLVAVDLAAVLRAGAACTASSVSAVARVLLPEAALAVFAALATVLERRVAGSAAATYALSQRSITAGRRARTSAASVRGSTGRP